MHHQVDLAGQAEMGLCATFASSKGGVNSQRVRSAIANKFMRKRSRETFLSLCSKMINSSCNKLICIRTTRGRTPH